MEAGIKIDLEKCEGCGDCVPVCPFNAIEIVDEKARVKEGCNLCSACEAVCKSGAIIIEVGITTEVADEKDAYRGVWVFAEQRDSHILGVAYELVSEGRKLADALGTELSVVCFGEAVKDAEQVMAYGADKVYLYENPLFAHPKDDVYAKQLVRLIDVHRPEILLAGATSLGRSLMPRVAAILKTGLTADCTSLEIDLGNRLLMQTRPAFGGNIMATIICPQKRPQMATVRPRAFKKGAPKPGRKGEILRLDLEKETVTSQTKLLHFVQDLTQKVKLEDADIIVSGGRGVGKAENFHLIQELANVLGAAVGASRPVVEEGWIPYSHQVGQTGKTVSPKLYIACGISGSVQHLAGMQTSEIIVAINIDPNAAIFDVATYGIVGDLFEVVPALTAKLKKMRD